MVRISTRTKDAPSIQDQQTPPEFIQAVEKRFGSIAFDLAASAHNTQAERYFSIVDDSLQQDWSKLSHTLDAAPENPKLLWLNPPFGNIGPWSAKCALHAPTLARHVYIAFLVPASVGSNWFATNIWNRSAVKFLNGRIKFIGSEHVFPKDLMLCIFGDCPIFAETWKWRTNPPTTGNQKE